MDTVANMRRLPAIDQDLSLDLLGQQLFELPEAAKEVLTKGLSSFDFDGKKLIGTGVDGNFLQFASSTFILQAIPGLAQVSNKPSGMAHRR